MFSLIITIISIALVAALALATLYYGGSSWTRGNAAASAATLTNQGQQIRGAMELYYSKNSAYPATLDELVTGEYLKTVPTPPETVAVFNPSIVPPALAAGEIWTLLAAGQPAFMVHEKISKDVCQELNYLARGSDAVYDKIDGKSYSQCFGSAAGPFTFVVGVPGAGVQNASLEQAVVEYNEDNDPDLPIAGPGGLTPDDISVPETKNKSQQAQAPGGDEGDDETPAYNPGALRFYDEEWLDDIALYSPTTQMQWAYAVGELLDGNAASYLGVAVINTADDPVTVNGVSVTSPFRLDYVQCEGVTLQKSEDIAGEWNWVEELPTDDSSRACAVYVVLESYAAASITGTLTLHTDSGVRTLPLQANVTNDLGAGSIDFYQNAQLIETLIWPPTVFDGGTKLVEIELRNSAGGSFSVEELPTQGDAFWVDATNCSSSPPQSSCTVQLAFNPDAAGTFTGALVVRNADGTSVLPITATSTAPSTEGEDIDETDDGVELIVQLHQMPNSNPVKGSFIMVWTKHPTLSMQDVSVQVVSPSPAIRWQNIWGEVPGTWLDSDVDPSAAFSIYDYDTDTTSVLQAYYSAIKPSATFDLVGDEYFVGMQANGCSSVPGGSECAMFVPMTHPYSGGRCEARVAEAPTVLRLRYKLNNGTEQTVDIARTFTLGGPGTCI
jgi:type II secretory pathway pseudopilin PulG